MRKVTISIIGSMMPTGRVEDGFELMTDGEYSLENGISKFSYLESSLTGFDGLHTCFDVEPDRVILRRGGSEVADMIFCENQKHHFLYETPFGSVTMGIDTHSIKKNLRDDGGNLEIRYDIEVDNIAVSRNLFKIDIRS